MWFGAIARHPEQGTGCQLCEAGPAALCGDCFIQAVTERREQLRSAGVTLGEPAWSLGAAHQRLQDIQRPEPEQE
jgi:hypothetical protein